MSTLEMIKDFKTQVENASPDLIFLLKLQGLDTSFTEKTIQSIEDAVNRMWGKEPHKAMNTTVFLFGCLYGHSIINLLGEDNAYWALSEDTKEDDIALSDIEIKIKVKNDIGKITIFPFVRVNKFLQERNDNLLSMYYMLEMNVKYDVTSKEFRDEFCDADGWVKLKNGMQFRMLQTNYTPEDDIRRFYIPMNDFLNNIPTESTEQKLENDFKIIITKNSRHFDITGKYEDCERFCKRFDLLKFLPKK